MMGILNYLRNEEPFLVEKVVHALREDTGGYGEYLTEYALANGDLKGRRRAFRNVLVPREKGPTSESEIDVVLLHETGIYVVESKNYSGWIFGSADQQRWTQTLERGSKERFYNPIIQNRSHVRALAAYLGMPEEQFVSYIVFSKRCTLKVVPEDTDAYRICRRPDLMKKLRKDVEARGRVFDDERFEELEAALGRLESDSTDEAKAGHVEQAQRVQRGEVCPRCGGELVRRSGRYGEFMGCSNYPRCRYTRDL